MAANALGWVVVSDADDEFEIRQAPDRLPGLLFVPVREAKTRKNRFAPRPRPDDRDAEVERRLSLGAPAAVGCNGLAREYANGSQLDRYARRQVSHRGWCSRRLHPSGHGCSGGISPAWRQFGESLRALGFDPNIEEVERLRQAETLGGVSYAAAYAGLDQSHPFRKERGDRGPWGRNPWGRLSVFYAVEALRKSTLTNAQKTVANDWSNVELAPESQTVIVPEHLVANGVATVDFLKIDVDGVDLEVLHSFDAALESLQITGACLEVNFFGSECETDNTLHNTDRFMKAHGFELFDLTVRRYSMAALPSRFVYHVPAQSVFGRILQGDAIYFRDLGSDEHAGFAKTLAPSKLLNLICAFAVCNLPDCAADVAIRFRESISPLCSVAQVLDLLADQAQIGREAKLSYAELLSRFEAQDPMFFTLQ